MVSAERNEGGEILQLLHTGWMSWALRGAQQSSAPVLLTCLAEGGSNATVTMVRFTILGSLKHQL